MKREKKPAWRLLRPEEIRRRGDEYWNGREWQRTLFVGPRLEYDSCRYRRRVKD